MRFIPSGGKLVTESERDRQFGIHAEYVFGIERAEQRPPVEFRRSRIEQEGRCGALEKSGQAGKRRLPVLAERDDFVRLEPLKPGANTQLVAALRHRHAILIGKQIACNMQVAAIVATRQANRSLGVRSRAATHHYRAYLQSR